MFHTIEYNFSHRISISSSHGVLGPQRQGDKCIITLSESFYGKLTEMRSINRVRMMFKVIDLSDITMANGRGLNVNFVTDKNYTALRNTYNWPNKHHVTSADFRYWKKTSEMDISSDKS